MGRKKTKYLHAYIRIRSGSAEVTWGREREREREQGKERYVHDSRGR